MLSRNDILFRTCTSMAQIPAAQWDALLDQSHRPTPFMRHAYLLALEVSGAATAETGWLPRHTVIESASGELLAACPLYIKNHSYGEYIFDQAWAHAYLRHGLAYYPKAVIAVPFTPVPGSRIIGLNPEHRNALLHCLVQYTQTQRLSSLHLLWGCAADIELFDGLPESSTHLAVREQIQFHWRNRDYNSHEDYLMSLQQRKRKKIRAEQRKVRQAGIRWEFRQGSEITRDDWRFFFRCYTQTYLEHGNTPYLNEDFFLRTHRQMPQNWLLCLARRQHSHGQSYPIASSLTALNPDTATAYGRYWGATERVDCLHFDACYHQPIAWCIRNGYRHFEGGAQGSHKMARGLLPTAWQSAHWITEPAFAGAISEHTELERAHTSALHRHLEQQSPFRQQD